MITKHQNKPLTSLRGGTTKQSYYRSLFSQEIASSPFAHCLSVPRNDKLINTIGKIFLRCLLFLLLFNIDSSAQDSFPHYPDSLFSTYYYQRASQFKLLPYTPNDIIFLENSITDGGNWTALFRDKKVKNFGISGDVTKGVLNRLGVFVNRKSAKIFVQSIFSVNPAKHKFSNHEN